MTTHSSGEPSITGDEKKQIENALQRETGTNSSKTASLDEHKERAGNRVKTVDAFLPNEKRDAIDADKVELTEDDCYEELGFCFPAWKKWTILTVIFLVQVSAYRNAMQRVLL